jgi:uncharacterized protein
VDIGVLCYGFPRKSFYDYLQRLTDAGFETRIMFGSDQMIWREALSAAIDSVQNAPSLTAQQRRDILYNNAARFLCFAPCAFPEPVSAHSSTPSANGRSFVMH